MYFRASFEIEPPLHTSYATTTSWFIKAQQLRTTGDGVY